MIIFFNNHAPLSRILLFAGTKLSENSDLPNFYNIIVPANIKIFNIFE